MPATSPAPLRNPSSRNASIVFENDCFSSSSSQNSSILRGNIGRNGINSDRQHFEWEIRNVHPFGFKRFKAKHLPAFVRGQGAAIEQAVRIRPFLLHVLRDRIGEGEFELLRSGERGKIIVIQRVADFL